MKKFLFLLLGVFYFLNIFSYSDEYNVIKGIYENKEINQGSESKTENLQQAPYEQPKNTGIYEFKPQKTQPENIEKNIGEIVVSASQIMESSGMIPRSINIIDENEFKRYTNTGSVADVLEFVPGIDIRRYGPENALSTLSLRSGKSRQSLILINNIPANDLGTQDNDLSLLDLTGINKIEIVKGGLSSIYGANASAGVVNFLNDLKEKKLIKINLGYGSNNKQKLALSSSYKIFNIDYSISGSEERNKGYFVNSDYLKRNANFKANFGTDRSISEISGYYAKRANSIPYNEFGPTPAAKQYDEIYGLGFIEFLNIDFFKLKISGYIRGGDLIYKNSDYDIDDRHIKKENQLQVSGLYEEGNFFKGILGGEISNQELNSTKAGQNTLNNNAIFSNITLFLFEKLTLNAAGRIDNNKIYGENKSGSFGIKYLPDQSIEIYGSIEYAFSSPTLLELFWNEKIVYDFGGGFTYTSETYGNKDLKTEKSVSYEAGIVKKEKTAYESLCFYKRYITDLIKWQVDTDFLSYDKSYPVNIDAAEVLGIEAFLKLMPFDFLNTGVNYTYTYAIDSKTKEKLAYTPEDKISAFLEILLPYKSRIGMTAEYVDFRFDTKKLIMDEYYIFNAYFIQKINDEISCNINVNNLFDNKDYMVINKIKMPGREIMASLQIEF